jgi:hypothetical protein
VHEWRILRRRTIHFYVNVISKEKIKQRVFSWFVSLNEHHFAFILPALIYSPSLLGENHHMERKNKLIDSLMAEFDHCDEQFVSASVSHISNVESLLLAIYHQRLAEI